ncbi:MAG: sigma-70 family RNA polymerase sigma factor [Pirellulaceae bacterium]
MSETPPTAAVDEEILARLRLAAEGDSQPWQELVEAHRPRLQRMVALRIDRRMQRRASASDIVQEAYLEAAEHLGEYLKNPKMPLYLWLRGITGNKLLELHRHHLGFKMRDAARDVALDGGGGMHSNSRAVAAALAGDNTSPSMAAARREMKHLLEEALDSLDPLDREVLALRHYEHLTNGEVAQVLGIDTSAASKRYVRALRRLKGILAPGADRAKDA